MTVKLGGVSGTPDVAVALSNSSTKTMIINRLTSAVPVTLAAASTTSNMIDYIGAFVNNPANVPTGGTALVDNPSICGIIPVRGSANTAPTNAQIRSAITADGGTGTTAYYTVLATISIAKNTTTITSSNITQGASALIPLSKIETGGYVAESISSAVTIGTSDTLVKRIYLSPGVWFVSADIDLNANGTETGDSSVKIKKNGTNIGDNFYWSNLGSSYWFPAHISRVVTVDSSSDNISVYVSKARGTLEANHSYISAFRIA